MRRLSGPAVFLLALTLSASVFAAAYVIQPMVAWFKRGVYLGTGAVASANNLVTRSLASGAITYDCADTATLTCTDSSAQTVTGALVGDTCTVSPNATAGALSGVWTCYVSATNSVIIKFCNPTAGSINPASGSFRVRVFSNQ